MKAAAKQQEKEMFRQTEMAYNVDFNIQQMEGRVAKMKGDNRNKDEQHYMEEKIERLEKALEEKRKGHNVLQFQVNEVEYNMRKLTNTYNADNLELERVVSILIVIKGEFLLIYQLK
jgi:coiled-coil domain-containing protein 39